MLSVTYLRREWNGTEVVTTSVTEDIPAVPSDGSMTGGKYFLDRDVTVNSRVELTGDAELILGDDFTLDVKGLYIPAGSTLTIYGQAAGTGKIYSHPSGGAAIGGYSQHDNGNIVIHGGTIEANGYDNCAGIGSNGGRSGGAITIYGGAITIYGGTITAIGGSDGAAIGGGLDCDGGTITIYGGDITANGPTDSDSSENGAGIGGGRYGSGGNITIYGGTITTYSRDGAGIGGGDDGDGGTITINGGTITSNKVNLGQGARIGGGCDAAPGTIVINGGNITTDGGSGAGIGGGKRNTSDGSVTINGGVISAGGSGSVTSGEGILYVQSTPVVIRTQPQNMTANEGSEAYMTISATGSNLKYRWQLLVNGNWTDCSAAGHNTARLKLTTTAGNNGRKYRCIVSSGSFSVTSNSGTLTVRLNKPVIKTQPQDMTVNAGAEAYMTISATGSNLSYRWQLLVNGSWTDCSTSGYNTARLKLTTSAGNNGRQYRCIVSDSVGSVTSNPATLTIIR